VLNDNFSWQGSGNVYAVPHNYQHGRETWTLATWQAKSVSNANSFEDLPLQFDPTQYRILPDSPGYVKRADGRDFGADVDRILQSVPATTAVSPAQ
jgi:hypothetical protein